MPECLTCGSNQFELIDGLYYCQTCQTQSQDLQEEELEYDAETTNISVHLRINQSKIKPENTKKATDYGRPWQTHEGWTIIIKHQVEALIKLGADPRLKDVVLRLWMLYLSKCGVAFNMNSTPHPLSVTHHRDKVVPSVTEPTRGENTNTMKSVRKRMSVMTTVRQENEKREREKLKESMQGEEFYEEDNPFLMEDGADNSDISSEGDEFIDTDNLKEEKDSEEHEAKEYTDDQEVIDEDKNASKDRIFEKKKERTNPQYMTGNKTLAFCYMGLMYVHDLLAPIDLIRWVDTGQVPFKCNIASLFPDDMKFCPDDAESFRARHLNKLPSVSALRMEASSLMCFLNIKGSKPMSLEMVCSRYIVELKLPGEFHRLVRAVINYIPYKLRPMKVSIVGQGLPKSYQEYELLAVGIIIMLLKLLFGLDGNTEIKIANYASKLEKTLKFDAKMFIMEEWLNYMNYVIQDPNRKYLPSKISDIPSQQDIEPILKDFVETQEALSRVLDQRISRDKRTKAALTRKDEFKDTITRQLSVLKERYEYHEEKEQRRQKEEQPSPLRPIPEFQKTTNSLINLLEQSAATKEKQSHHADAAEITNHQNISDNHFREATLDYLLDGNFLSKCQKSSDDNNDPDRSKDCLDTLFSSDIPAPFSQTEVITSTQLVSQRSLDNSISSQDCSFTSPHKKDIADLETEVEDINNLRQYWYVPLGELKQMPVAYERLLRICHAVIGCSTQEINTYVRRVEYMFLETKELLTAKKKELRTTYLRTHFDIPKGTKVSSLKLP